MATSQFRNLDTDTSLGGSSSSDYVVASQKAIKTYVDNHGGGGGLPDQTGQSGKFLTTDGTDASWSDKPLVNNSIMTAGLAVGSSSEGYLNAVAVGVSAKAKDMYTVAVGNNAYVHSANSEGGIAIGRNAYVDKFNGIAIGNQAKVSATRAIQIGKYGSGITENPDANTFKVANANGNFEIMSADGTIPEARLADTTNAQQGDVLTLDSTGNAVWQAGGGGGSVAIDNSTITKNTSDEIQAVAVIDQNTGIAKTWTGTQAEYDAIVTKDPETEYIITDDIGGPATVIAELAEGLNDKADVSALNTKTAHVVTEFQAPTAANNYTWYRKYADGWVEQGGRKAHTSSDATQTVDLPVEMEDTNYFITRTTIFNSDNDSWPSYVSGTKNLTTTSFSIATEGHSGWISVWEVKGMAA